MTPALEAQERAARESRKWLAWKRCKCGQCGRKNVTECVLCGGFQPDCRIDVHEMAPGVGVRWRCHPKEGCSRER